MTALQAYYSYYSVEPSAPDPTQSMISQSQIKSTHQTVAPEQCPRSVKTTVTTILATAAGISPRGGNPYKIPPFPDAERENDASQNYRVD